MLDGGAGDDVLIGGDGNDTLLNGEVVIQSFSAGMKFGGLIAADHPAMTMYAPLLAAHGEPMLM